MNNRTAEMDIFLQQWARIYMQNPNYPISFDTLYTSLSQYGLNEYEIKQGSIENKFNNWQEYFKNNPNLHVYHDCRQQLFLQFHSYEDPGIHHVKLYLSYPIDKIEYCVKKIFDYISSHKMPTVSKVANILRSDCVVLRLANYDDALDVINFINNDPILSSSTKPTNPFMMQQGNIGVSYDGSLSYNTTLVALMIQYFNFCRNNNILNTVSNENFRNYISEFYQNSFRNPNNLRQFLKLPDVARFSNRFQSIGDAIVNYEQIIKLILMQLDNKMNLEDYHAFYEKAKDESKNAQMSDYYNQFITQANNLENQDKSMNSIEEQLLHNYIDYIQEKYGLKVAADQLAYYADGNINAITRTNNFRAEFTSILPPGRLLEITGLDILNYVQDYLNTKKIVSNDKYLEQLLHDYIDIAQEKYGLNGVVAHLAYYVQGHLDSITRTNNFRAEFASTLPPERLLEITGPNIFKYVQDYLSTKKTKPIVTENLYDVFIQACKATYQKYGYSHLYVAIKKAMTGDYSYFTNGQELYREQMMKINPAQIDEYCRQLLIDCASNVVNNDLYASCCNAIASMCEEKINSNGRGI